MRNDFKKEDLGGRILLILDPKKTEGNFSEEEEEESCIIPYEAIKDYRFLLQIRLEGNNTAKIEVSSKNDAKRIDSSYIAKILGAEEIRIIGDIVEVADSYLKINIVEDRTAPWLRTKIRYY